MRIGKIISVEYDKFRVKLFHNTKISTVNIEGKVYYFGNIGSYLKVNNSLGDSIICEVVSVLDSNNDANPFSEFNLDSSRELILKPIGTLFKKNFFTMGVGIFPSIYSDVQIVTEENMRTIFTSKEESITNPNIHSYFDIGTSKNFINYHVNISINKLFNIHTAVLGNSGSGKSNTICHIFQELLRKKTNSGLGIKIILLDVNGEYKSAFDKSLDSKISTHFYKPQKSTEHEKFELPYYLMNLDEWSAFLMASDKTQKPFWDKVLQECYRFYKIDSDENIVQLEYINYLRFKLLNILNFIFSRVDSDTANVTSAASAIRKIQSIIIDKFKLTDNVKKLLKDITFVLDKCTLSYGVQNSDLLNSLAELKEKIDFNAAYKIEATKLKHGNFYDYNFLKIACEIVLLEENAKGNYKIYDNTSTMMSRLDYFLDNPECDFMKVDNKFVSEEDYLKKVLYINSDSRKQLIVIDSSELSRDILELSSSVLCRIIYDYKRKSSGAFRKKNPIHLVLDEAHRYIKKDSDYLLKENIFEKIAREGRKYSIYLVVSSQRPSELSSTVLSQCGNYIIHRIQNEYDMNYIYSVLPYFSSDYIMKIKQSIPGEALIFGNCVPIPTHLKIHLAHPSPDSENCVINYEWYSKK